MSGVFLCFGFDSRRGHVKMTDEELMELSRKYKEHEGDIKEAMIRQLNARRPQVLIARDFGIERSALCHIARKLGIYYNKSRK